MHLLGIIFKFYRAYYTVSGLLRSLSASGVAAPLEEETKNHGLRMGAID